MGIGLGLGGDMEVDDGALEGLMTEELLDMADRHIGLDEVRGVGMPEDVGMHVLFDGQSPQGALEDDLQGAFAGVGGGGPGPLALVAPEGWEEPLRIAVGGVIIAEQGEGDDGQGDDPVHRALAGVDVNETAIAEDVRDLQGEGFTQAQAEGVERGVVGAALEGGQGLDDPLDFLAAENRRQFLVALDAYLVQERPGTDQRTGEEMFDAAVADAQRGGTPAEVGSAGEPVLPQVFLGDVVQRLLEETLHSVYGGNVGLTTPFGVAG